MIDHRLSRQNVKLFLRELLAPDRVQMLVTQRSYWFCSPV